MNYAAGQKADSKALGDPGTTKGNTFTPNWDPAFLQDIHGVILVSGDSHPTVDNMLNKIKGIFGVGTPNASVKEVKSLVGDVRPGNESGHEQYVFILLIFDQHSNRFSGSCHLQLRFPGRYLKPHCHWL